MMARKGMIAIILMGLSLASLLLFQLILRPTASRVEVDAAKLTQQVVWPVWTRVNVWDLEYAPASPPAPFIREVILMTATGGRESCEMFSYGEDGRPRYDFAKIDSALDKVLLAGLMPTIVIGNTPEAMSDSPGEKGAFDANVGAPVDHDVYSGYIEALFEHLVGRYGLERVQSWGYRLMTEPDNTDWWRHGRLEYQKLYDYTLAAARSAAPGLVIDPGNLMIPVGRETWFPHLSRWISTGQNALVPGALPRSISQLGLSCYARGQMGMDPRELGEIVQEIRGQIEGLDDVAISVDEGMILFDEDGRRLWLGDGTELGAAWNAALIKVCLDNDVKRFVQWGFQTDGVNSPSCNVLCMFETILGQTLLKTKVRRSNLPSGSYLDALSCMDGEGNVRMILFHYAPDRYLTFDAEVKLSVDGMAPGLYQVRHWRVDRDHSNFFSQWLADSEDIIRLDVGSGSGSKWDLAATNVLGKEGWELWNSRKEAYLEMDDLEMIDGRQVQLEGDFVMDIVLPANSVSLVELIAD
jgi:xylan 1,4-beta-xylosidase